MTRSRWSVLALAAALAFPGLTRADDGKDGRSLFLARLISFEEVPAIAAPGTAMLRMELSQDGMTLSFTLTYENLTAAPLVAHVHFGQRSVSGAPMFFFCGGGGKPACPDSTSGTITGTVVAADVVGPAAQGIAAGDLATVVDVMRRGLGYANMHTPAHPTGEIRGQVIALRNHW